MVDKSNNKNQIDNGIDASKSSWTFSSDEVAANFDEHVKKSVPLYDIGQDIICKLSSFFISNKVF